MDYQKIMTLDKSLTFDSRAQPVATINESGNWEDKMADFA
jgi:hypothetical protein